LSRNTQFIENQITKMHFFTAKACKEINAEILTTEQKHKKTIRYSEEMDVSQ